MGDKYDRERRIRTTGERWKSSCLRFNEINYLVDGNIHRLVIELNIFYLKIGNYYCWVKLRSQEWIEPRR